MNIFEEAGRRCLRFSSVHGHISVEDLWNIRLKDLDDMAMGYKNEIDSFETESFLVKKVKVQDTELTIKFEICKSVIETRVADLDKKEKTEATRVRNNKIMELIVSKEDDALKESSIEELREMMSEE